MLSRIKIVRIKSSHPQRLQLDSLFTCKRGCDIKYAWPFGSAEKRRACKADCEEKWREEAEEDYPLPTMPTMGVPTQTQTAGLNVQSLLPLALIAGGIYYFTKKK